MPYTQWLRPGVRDHVAKCMKDLNDDFPAARYCMQNIERHDVRCKWQRSGVWVGDVAAWEEPGCSVHAFTS